DLEVGADVELRLWSDDRGRLLDLERHAPFLPDLVVEARLRVIRPAVPAHTTTNIGAQGRRLDFARREITTANQLAGLGIDVLDEVDVLDETPDVLDRKIAIIDEDETALVRVHHDLLTVAIEHQELADRAIEIPGIVRQFLMVGFQLA